MSSIMAAPSRSSLDFSTEKEDAKTTIGADRNGSRVSVSDASDTATDVRAGAAPVTANNADKTDPASLPVEYRYFTFDTQLPPPNINASSASSELPAPAPQEPDLKPFVDPHLWSARRKNTMLALSCIATCLTAYAAGSYSPPSQRIADAFGVSLYVVLFAGITMFCIGFGLAPMLLAPFSEYNGRYPVFIVAGFVFVLSQLVCGAAPHIGLMLVARFFVGVGGSVFSTMVGGVIADMWHADGRNTPMTLFSGSVLLGTGCGPLISGVITYRTTYPQNQSDSLTSTSPSDPWRWVFWHQVIADLILMIALVFLFQESRGSVLLSRKAKALNEWYEAREAAGYVGVWMKSEDLAAAPERKMPAADEIASTAAKAEKGSEPQSRQSTVLSPETAAAAAAPVASASPQLHRVRWIVKDDEDRTTLRRTISMSVYRPFHMFFTEPVVFFFSLWVAFAWAVLYLMFGSVFLVFETTYGFNMEQAGYAFSALLIGGAVATVIGLFQDRIFSRLAKAVLPARLHNHARLQPGVPEGRLYVACLTSALLPIGLFMFGFTARPDIHWAVPMVGIGLSTIGIFAVYLSTFNYLADVYHRFASSALAAQSCARNILGGIFPLVMHALFTHLGTAHAGAVLGSIGAALTFVPWVLAIFGESIRRRSKFAMSLA
ncbi:mfs transporter [Ophiostoma piceae UAMH 11346]|uniref:Mfs transporter n=1 Tax=Ophiostoma piceae (strain UAMH 11346) TaxID=1262450 RepID=S3C4U9_OPHP1|nr:mfs transporter [Ophiostoma piceae UAMH 11346]